MREKGVGREFTVMAAAYLKLTEEERKCLEIISDHRICSWAKIAKALGLPVSPYAAACIGKYTKRLRRKRLVKRGMLSGRYRITPAGAAFLRGG